MPVSLLIPPPFHANLHEYFHFYKDIIEHFLARALSPARAAARLLITTVFMQSLSGPGLRAAGQEDEPQERRRRELDRDSIKST